MGAYISFYHYTDERGKDAIVRENRILQSNGPNDIKYGRGRVRIALNNWDGTVNPGMLMKTAWAIRVEIPAAFMVKVAQNQFRDIWIYPAGDLPLLSYKVIQVA